MPATVRNTALRALIAAVASSSASALAASPEDAVPSQIVSLVSSISARDDGKPFLVGLDFALPKGWKTYWRTAEPGGMSPKIVFTASSNVRRVRLLWPTPHLLSGPGGEPPFTLGYKAPFILAARVEANSGPVHLNVAITYGLCNDDICIPRSRTLSVAIPAGPARTSTRNNDITRAARDTPGILVVDRSVKGKVVLRPAGNIGLTAPLIGIERRNRLDVLRNLRPDPPGREVRMSSTAIKGAVAVLLIDGPHGWMASPPTGTP